MPDNHASAQVAIVPQAGRGCGAHLNERLCLVCNKEHIDNEFKEILEKKSITLDFEYNC